ncbi:MAG: WD40 repeat domain-containing protein, partial [Candidatus Helarchaeota archaeon]
MVKNQDLKTIDEIPDNLDVLGIDEIWNYEEYGFYDLSMSSDGNYIVVDAATSGDLHLFNNTSGVPEWSYNGIDPFSGSNRVAISGDGNYIACSDGSTYVRFFHRDNNTPLWSHALGGSTANKIGITDNGSYFIVVKGSYAFQYNSSGTTYMWYNNTAQDAETISFSLDGKYYVTAGQQMWLYFHTTSSPNYIWRSYNGGNYADITDDGEYIVTSGTYNSYWGYHAKIFHKSSNVSLYNFTLDANGQGVSVSGDGKFMSTIDENGKVYCFDVPGRKELWTYDLPGVVEYTDCVKFAKNTKFFTISWGGSIYLFHVNKSTPLWSYSLGGDPKYIAISHDGEYIGAAQQSNHYVYLLKNSFLSPNSTHPEDMIT